MRLGDVNDDNVIVFLRKLMRLKNSDNSLRRILLSKHQKGRVIPLSSLK